MAVVGIAQERPDSPRGRLELGRQVLTRKFLVETNSKNDGPLTVTAAIGIPAAYQTYATPNEFHPYVRCRSVDAERRAPGSLFWEVTAEYSTPDPKDGNFGNGPGTTGGGTGLERAGEYDNPQLELPEAEGDWENVREPITQIYDTTTRTLKPVTNSANMVISPPPEKDVARFTLTITRNEPITAQHPYLGVYYMDAVNQDVFWSSPPGQAKIMAIKPKKLTKQLLGGRSILSYLRVTYVIQFRASWDIQHLDHGPYWLDRSMDPANNRQVGFQDRQGHPVESGLLNGSGRPLGGIEDPNDPAYQQGDPVFLTLRPYPRLPFAALNLPQSFQETR
jgi:hypothetical protein